MGGLIFVCPTTFFMDPKPVSDSSSPHDSSSVQLGL